MTEFLLGGLILIVTYLIIMVCVVHYKQDRSIGNFTWGGGATLLTLYTFFVASNYLPRQKLVTFLIVLWCLRMIVYLYSRYKKGSDPRFVEWRTQYGAWAFLVSLWWIVVMNGALLLVMALPGMYVNTRASGSLTLLDVAGLALWLLGFVFESIGDYQLYQFMQKPENKGTVMKEGLWRYSRHPNYFGEICMWWGIFLILLSVPGGWMTIISPLTITILLVFVTGIPWLEAVFANNPEYQEYKKHTSMLIPWPPQ